MPIGVHATALKEAVTMAPVLTYPQFEELFWLDTKARNEDLGEVL